MTTLTQTPVSAPVNDTKAHSSISFVKASTSVSHENLRTRYSTVAILFVTSVLYLRIFYNYTNLNEDEGIILQGAQRILNGEIPYRDCFSFITPGSYYWMALWFKIFGSSFLVARTTLVIDGGLFSVLTYLIARRFCSQWNAILATLPTTLVCLPYQFFTLHNWDSTLWACLSTYCAVLLLENGKWRWAMGLGFSVAACLLFEQSKGLGLVVGLFLAFVVLKLANWRRVQFTLLQKIGLIFGFMTPVLLVLAYFYSQHALPQFVDCLTWPIQHYSGVNKLPYGYLQGNWANLVTAGSYGRRIFGLFVLTPFLVLNALPILGLCLWGSAINQIRKFPRDDVRIQHQVLVGSVIFGLLLSSLMTSRPDSIHLMYSAPLFAIVLAWMSEAAQSPFLKTVRTSALSLAVASFAILGLALLFVPLNARNKLETRRANLWTSSPYEAFHYVQARVAPGETILVYPYAPIYYYLTGTYGISRYDWIIPDMYGQAAFEELAAQLRVTRPRVVLFNEIFNETVAPRWPHISLEALAARDPVESYVFAHYHPCRTFASEGTEWHMVFMLRDDLPCSTSHADRAGFQ